MIIGIGIGILAGLFFAVIFNIILDADYRLFVRCPKCSARYKLSFKNKKVSLNDLIGLGYICDKCKQKNKLNVSVVRHRESGVK